MPTILLVRGWRLFFYSNERNEPPHVHAQKGGAECKMWLLRDTYDVAEAWSHGLSPGLRRELRRIIFDHFDLIMDEWNRHHGGHHHAGH
ncbi:MAG: DUF4160 domain-containing protein [Planctomycetes bacterium]|nr:DUF4160 domain-containing protein [Planctomycetota bacterium]